METINRTQSFTNRNVLEYIQIDHKNKIVELPSDMHITEASSFLSSLMPFEENLGMEINNFFLSVLPENKEGEIFKVITAIANKAKIEKNTLHSYLTNILNMPEADKITLNKDLSEEISVVLREIYKKIKKKAKIKNYDDITKKVQSYMDNLYRDDILNEFKVKKSSETLGQKNNIFVNDNNYPDNKNTNTGLTSEDTYEYKEIKSSKDITLPIEMLILLRKFNMTKTLRLTINNDYYTNYDDISKSNEQVLNKKKNEIENIILILLNLDWLFPSLVELELDLSNINLIESQIKLHKYSLDVFAKSTNKETKITAYQSTTNNNFNKRTSEPLYKSVFPQFSFIDEDELLGEKTSNSNTSNSQISLKQEIDYNEVTFSEDKYNKEFAKFIKNHQNLMEMIIIYGYFIGKMKRIINAKLIMPINIGGEIFQFLKSKNIFMDDFHILSFITKKDIINLSLEFNSLDSQTFEKILNFLNQNPLICNLEINFFPEEELFKTELLFNLLQSSDENFKLKKHKNNKLGFNPNIIFDTKVSESLDDFILRRLSEFFEKNLQNFFYLLTMNSKISKLSLIFDIPTIMVKNGYYNNVLMKFFLNLFILINSPLNSNIKHLSLVAENFILDTRKYPLLNDFCDKLNFYKKTNHKMQSLTFHVKFYRLPKIYRFIPTNLIFLSIGSLDYETFENLVNYLTSSDFGINSKLAQLKISLNNSLIDIHEKNLYDILLRLFTEYPKGLKELSLHTYLIVPYDELRNILMKTNYNTLGNIFLQFSVKSILNGKNLEEKLEHDLTEDDKNLSLNTDSFFDLYAIKRDNAVTNKIINLLMNLGKINKDVLQYSIYSNIEKFLCPKELKKVLIRFK